MEQNCHFPGNKYSMKTKAVGFTILTICLILIVIFIILQSIPDLLVKTPRVQTAFLITSLLDDFDALDDSEQHQIILTLDNSADSIEINRRFCSFFESRSNNIRPLNGFNSSNGIFRDEWGTPLLFTLTNNPIYGRLNPRIKGRPRPFVIWSAGSNHTNELGYGDDVVTGQ